MFQIVPYLPPFRLSTFSICSTDDNRNTALCSLAIHFISTMHSNEDFDVPNDDRTQSSFVYVQECREIYPQSIVRYLYTYMYFYQIIVRNYLSNNKPTIYWHCYIHSVLCKCMYIYTIIDLSTTGVLSTAVPHTKGRTYL